MSARSTGTFSFKQMYCCLRRDPQVLCRRLKRIPPELSVAGKTFTGIDTRPKVREREAIERAAIGPPSFEAGSIRVASCVSVRSRHAASRFHEPARVYQERICLKLAGRHPERGLHALSRIVQVAPGIGPSIHELGHVVDAEIRG